jgi:hypothetical protein
MQPADVQSRAPETAFNIADAAFEIAHIDLDVRAHAVALAQLLTSRSNEPQRFCDAYRKADGDIALEYIDADHHTGARRICCGQSIRPRNQGHDTRSGFMLLVHV